MIPANDVNPKAWSNKNILFDNGEYSVISGDYRDEGHCLGIRWNGEPGLSKGYPVQGKYPLWFVLPESIKTSTLYSLKEKLLKLKYPGWKIHCDNILHEMEK